MTFFDVTCVMNKGFVYSLLTCISLIMWNETSFMCVPFTLGNWYKVIPSPNLFYDLKEIITYKQIQVSVMYCLLFCFSFIFGPSTQYVHTVFMSGFVFKGYSWQTWRNIGISGIKPRSAYTKQVPFLL